MTILILLFFQRIRVITLFTVWKLSKKRGSAELGKKGVNKIWEEQCPEFMEFKFGNDWLIE